MSLHPFFDEGDFCRESLPMGIGKGRHWTSVFFCGCTSNNQDSLKASPMAIFKWKNLMEQLDRACWVQSANMWKNCSLSAVQRKTAFVEESWWPECNLLDQQSLCSFPWHKHLPRLAQKDCCTVYSLNLIHKFTSLFRWRWFLQVCQGKPSHGNRKR